MCRVWHVGYAMAGQSAMGTGAFVIVIMLLAAILIVMNLVQVVDDGKDNAEEGTSSSWQGKFRYLQPFADRSSIAFNTYYATKARTTVRVNRLNIPIFCHPCVMPLQVVLCVRKRMLQDSH